MSNKSKRCGGGQTLTGGGNSDRRFTPHVDKRFVDDAAGFNDDRLPGMDDAAWPLRAFMQDTAET